MPSARATLPTPLPEPLVDVVAKRFRVLGEPLRIRLLDRLRESPASVMELQEAVGASQQNVSKHLGILHDAGMVDRSKAGTRTVYAISDPMVFELCELVCSGVQRQVGELQRILEGR